MQIIYENEQIKEKANEMKLNNKTKKGGKHVGSVDPLPLMGQLGPHRKAKHYL